MRTAPTAIAAALLAALTLTACGGNDGGDSGDGGKTAASPSGDGKGSGSACATAGTAFAVGPSSAAPAAGDEGAVPVTVTNKSGAPCTVTGLARVELLAGGKSWPLAAQEGAAKDAELTLAEGQSVTFTIAYVRGIAGDAQQSADVQKLSFSLPGEKKAHTYDWPDAEVALQSGDTLEATVGPFTPVGD
ncbi:DUF4232 domain-containing protein [Streptomyces heilongjiangensis]|uniref:DUF4232 domain-containing protein n=1 Tax=Streptomyces heilongjiangensis TaxID=945052 RepID=A0ABW1BE54_9ACTN|nr:DUF4232 domain-containing protein [Streptomyces heilongjiangensis]MDC2949504.1 DUF4232 domain-containing protein [Streptomyces heilongjiangensis]